ncbi:hypothetical protein OIV70_23125, partial [Burkholderia pseudomallei]|uniref:hypothetical protein n=1 Tax=Burkholderia pseudomallei TaxID=28450 RepID=UPI0021F73D70
MAMTPDSVKLHVSMIGIGISYPVARRRGRKKSGASRIEMRRPMRISREYPQARYVGRCTRAPEARRASPDG